MDSQEEKDRKKIIHQGIEDFLDDHELDISAQNKKRLTNHLFKHFENSRSISTTSVNNELSSIFEYNELYRKAMDSKEGEASEELLMSIMLSADNKKSNKSAKRIAVLLVICFVFLGTAFYIYSMKDYAPITVAQSDTLKNLVDDVVNTKDSMTHQALWLHMKDLDTVKQYGYQSSYKDFSQGQFYAAKAYLEKMLNDPASLPSDFIKSQFLFSPEQIEVVDGDTFKVKSERYRLWGIDAFEMDQTCFDKDKHLVNCGEEAKTALQNIMDGAKTIECSVETKDRYKRSVVKCIIDGEMLGELLIRTGWVLDYTKYSDGEFLEEQKVAQDNHQGAWSGCFIAPWDYRHNKNMDACK